MIGSSLFRNIAAQAGFRDTEWKKLVIIWASISAVVLLVSVFTTIDYHHLDEHWQTIEFANYKLNHHDVSKMAWEFPAKMRPWLQPAIYFLIAKVSYAAGLQNPFVIATFFRFFSAFFAWIMLTSMMFCSYHLFNDKSRRKAALACMSLLAFLPYMFVRTSSESLSSSFLMIGFAALILGSTPESGEPEVETKNRFIKRIYSRKLLFIVGILWGIAFEFRYQSAFLTAGFIFWLFFISTNTKENTIAKRVIAITFTLLGIFLVIITGTLIDWWGYGELTFAPWNYLYQNIFLSKASGFGTLPFYGYIQLLFSQILAAPMLLVLFIGSLIGIIRYPRHPLAWGTTIFFLAHSFIGHKELRFLMNVLIPSIFLMVYGFSPGYHNNTTDTSPFLRIWKYRLSLPAKLLYFFNILVLVLFSFFLNDGAILLEKYLYNNIEKSSVVYALKDSPYAPLGAPLQQDFYKPNIGVRVITIDSLNNIPADSHDKNMFYVISSDVTLQLPEDFIIEETYVFGPNLHDYIKGKIKILLHYKPKYYPAIWTLYHVRIKTI